MEKVALHGNGASGRDRGAATRLVSISDLTRGLRPGLDALPPLRGWLE